MKKFVYIIIVIVLGVYAWNKYDLEQYINRVKVSVTDLQEKENTAQIVVEEHNDARQDLFQILTLMNEVTVNTMKLEQMTEGKKQNSEQLSMKKHLEEKMEILKKQLSEARENAKDNAELHEEVEQLQKSLLQREQTIRRLATEDEDLDAKIQEAINELGHKNRLLSEENLKLSEKIIDLRAAIDTRKKAELASWEMAGDELKEAARMIPKPNSPMFAKKQSIEITRSKQMVLKSATECYISEYKMAKSYGFKEWADRAEKKRLEADRLFNLVTAYKSIGETE